MLVAQWCFLKIAGAGGIEVVYSGQKLYSITIRPATPLVVKHQPLLWAAMSMSPQLAKPPPAFSKLDVRQMLLFVLFVSMMYQDGCARIVSFVRNGCCDCAPPRF